MNTNRDLSVKLRALELGRQSEDRVAEWVQTRTGFIRLVARNDRHKQGEIDLIYEEVTASGIQTLVFVEVKASAESLEMALWNMGPAKLRKLRRAIQIFLQNYKGQACGVRIDLALMSQNKVEYREGVLY